MSSDAVEAVERPKGVRVGEGRVAADQNGSNRGGMFHDEQDFNKGSMQDSVTGGKCSGAAVADSRNDFGIWTNC